MLILDLFPASKVFRQTTLPKDLRPSSRWSAPEREGGGWGGREDCEGNLGPEVFLWGSHPIFFGEN